MQEVGVHDIRMRRANDNPDLEDEGVVDEAAGDVREGFGTAKRKVGEAVKDIGDAIKR